MSDNTIGTLYRVTTFGESHGVAIGAVIDGCPAGVPLSVDILSRYLRERRPGTSPFASPRKESDVPEILSGVYNNLTLGTPIAVIVKNTDARSDDYAALEDVFRPGHADYTYEKKYGLRDPRGGGRSSGRETLGRVIGGAVAQEILKLSGITVSACVSSVGEVSCDEAFLASSDLINASRANALRMPDVSACKRAEKCLKDIQQKGDSLGSTVFCRIEGCPPGLGRPVFSKLEARLSAAIMSIGACRGIAFGSGFDLQGMTGSAANDPFIMTNRGISTETGHGGGVLGGISTGNAITFRAVFKPTPSISLPQKSVTASGTETTLRIRGRHDPVIGPRAVPVVEAMAAIILLDEMLSGAFARLSTLKAVTHTNPEKL